MSAKFEVVVIGAPLLKLWQFYYCLIFITVISSLVLFILCCFSQQRLLSFPSVSMRFRPKRTCSGVECFGGFHIKRFIALFLFFRETLT